MFVWEEVDVGGSLECLYGSLYLGFFGIFFIFIFFKSWVYRFFSWEGLGEVFRVYLIGILKDVFGKERFGYIMSFFELF